MVIDVTEDSRSENEISLHFSVKDTGIGLPPEFLERIFDAFERIAATANPSAQTVAGGIQEALVTTATGLIIAIPAQLVYNWYTTKITRFVRAIETATNMLMETFIEMDSQRYGQGGEAPQA